MASNVFQSEILTTDEEHAWHNFFNMLKKLGVFLDEPHGTFLLQGCNQCYNGFYMSLNNQEYNKKPCYFKVFPSVAVNDKRPMSMVNRTRQVELIARGITRYHG